jgi:hypothetical protein
VTLPPVLRHIAVRGGLVAYGGNPGALADVTEARTRTLAVLSPFRELAACLGDVRAAVIVPGRGPYAAGTLVAGRRVTNVLCALPAPGSTASALAAGVRSRAAGFAVADGDTVRPLPATTRIEIVAAAVRTVRVRLDDARVDGDAFLSSAVDGDLTALLGY